MQKVLGVSPKDLQRIEQQLNTQPRLQVMIEADPEVLALLKWAVSQRHEPNRWQSYEQAKSMSKTIVGWNARTPALRTPGCYEAFIDAIDALIPDDESELEAS